MISTIEKEGAPSKNVFRKGLGFEKSALLVALGLDRATVRVQILAIGARSCVTSEVFTGLFATVAERDSLVDVPFEMVDTRAIRHLPIPAVRPALGHEIDLLASSTSQRDLAGDEPSTFAHVLRVGARKQGSGVAVGSLTPVQCVGQETERAYLAYIGILFSCHCLSTPFAMIRPTASRMLAY